jgi:hypothetical protein
LQTTVTIHKNYQKLSKYAEKALTALDMQKKYGDKTAKSVMNRKQYVNP